MALPYSISPKTIAANLAKVHKKINRLDAEILLAHVLKKTREFVVAHPEHILTAFQDSLFGRLAKKRSNSVPLAYLTGHKEFYGLDFLVNKNVLVPRPETETMVERVIEHVTHNTQHITFVDVGTGSGCIPVAIAATLKHLNNQTFKQIYAIDIFPLALTVARKNAKKYGIRIKFLQGNLLKPFIDCYVLRDTCYVQNIVITANLPYLTEKQYESEPSIQHEPKHALVASKNGLALYEELLQQIKTIDMCYVLHVSCYMEIDPSQSTTITKLIRKYFPNAEIEIKKDLAGLDRVVCVEI